MGGNRRDLESRRRISYSVPGSLPMVCTAPISAWPASPDAQDRRIVFSSFRSYQGARAKLVPCGQCLSCRLTKAQNWATRIHHEASGFEDNVFVTLTYSEDHLPADLSVSKAEFDLFIRRLIEHYGATRYFACGEYGGQTKRPHYHAILFGQGFPDRYFWSKSPGGDLLYRSPTLEKIWGKGNCLIGAVTLTSAEYVARYTVKKVNGDRVAAYLYRGEQHPLTGEIPWSVDPEFITMSRNPGLGSDWLEKFHRDVFPSDFLVINGRKRAVPPFYLRKLDDMEKLRLVTSRKSSARQHAHNNTDRRLMARTEVRELRADRLKRDFDGRGE
jgi:hypothetical protein